MIAPHEQANYEIMRSNLEITLFNDHGLVLSPYALRTIAEVLFHHDTIQKRHSVYLRQQAHRAASQRRRKIHVKCL